MSVSLHVYVLCVNVCVQVCPSKPFKAGNEQAEDCCNYVTQMSWVQILHAENESADQGLVPPPLVLSPAGTQSQSI